MEPPPEYLPLWNGAGLRSAALQEARAYLQSRKLDQALWKPFQIGAAVDGFWCGRVIIPALSTDDDAQWLGWIGRLWRNPSKRAEGFAAMKYLYPKGMQRGVTFWNHRALHVESDAPVMVMEGALDAIGYGDDAVACLGKLSMLQLEALLACRRPVSIVLDGDAWRESWATAARLRFEGKRAGFVKLPPKVDPDEVDHSWLRELALRSLEAPL
jgi:DNA primase